ncbi:MAG: hypothetical protein HYZ42_18255 [Bacteroidetes bacterium]|nr:hypothetical protein [Bacteroidota bacterium]
MKKIYFLLTLFIATSTLSVNAQKKKRGKEDVPKDRIEINVDENSITGYVRIFGLDTNGVATMSNKWNKESNGCLGIGAKYTNDYVIEKYNKNLTKEYEVALGIEMGTFLVGTYQNEDKIYVLGTKDYISYNLIEFDTKTKKLSNVDVVYPQTVYFRDMLVKDGNALLFSLATISKKKQIGRLCYSTLLFGIPVIFGSLNFPSWVYMAKIDLKKKKTELVKLDEFGKKPHNYYMGSNTGMAGKPGTIIIKDVVKKKAKVYSKTFKFDGSELKLGENAELEINKKLEIYTAKVNNLDDNERLIYGNYGKPGQTTISTNESNYKLKGAYYSKMEGKRLKWSQTQEYKKIVPKNQYVKYRRPYVIPLYLSYGGITLNFAIQWPGYSGTELLMHDVITTDDQLIYIGETRTAKFIYKQVQRGDRIVYIKVFDGWLCNGFLVSSYDKTGKILWNKAIKFPTTFHTYYEGKEFLNVYPDGERLAFGFFNGGGISTYYLDADNKFSNTPVNSKNAKIPTNTESKKKKTVVYGADALKWTDNTYLVYGSTKLKNAKAERRQKYSNGVRKGKYRNVIFLSKVVVETQD